MFRVWQRVPGWPCHHPCTSCCRWPRTPLAAHTEAMHDPLSPRALQLFDALYSPDTVMWGKGGNTQNRTCVWWFSNSKDL